MAPGMGHCSGGEGPNTFDMVSALEQWVEAGKAPDQIVATITRPTAMLDRSRPLCPYPQVAVYKGTGSTDDAANFACRRLSESVNHFPIDDLVVYGVEMRNRQRAHRLNRKRDDLFGVAGRIRIAQLLPYGAKRTQHLRAVEALPVTMVTEAHSLPTTSSLIHRAR